MYHWIKLEFHMQHAHSCQLMCKIILTFGFLPSPQAVHCSTAPCWTWTAMCVHHPSAISVKLLHWKGAAAFSLAVMMVGICSIWKKKLQVPLSTVWCSQKAQTKTHILCVCFGLLQNTILSSYTPLLLTEKVLHVFCKHRAVHKIQVQGLLLRM